MAARCGRTTAHRSTATRLRSPAPRSSKPSTSIAAAKALPTTTTSPAMPATPASAPAKASTSPPRARAMSSTTSRTASRWSTPSTSPRPASTTCRSAPRTITRPARSASRSTANVTDSVPSAMTGGWDCFQWFTEDRREPSCRAAPAQARHRAAVLQRQPDPGSFVPRRRRAAVRVRCALRRSAGGGNPIRFAAAGATCSKQSISIAAARPRLPGRRSRQRR